MLARRRRPEAAEILAAMENAVTIAKRVNATWCTVVPGSVDQQYASDKKWNRYGGDRPMINRSVGVVREEKHGWVPKTPYSKWNTADYTFELDLEVR